MKQSFLYLMLLAVILEVVADILFKYWSLSSRSILLWGGMVLYALGTLAWAYSIKFESLSKAITVFTVLNMIVVVLAGVVIFGESLSLLNKLGVLLGVASIILVQL